MTAGSSYQTRRVAVDSLMTCEGSLNERLQCATLSAIERRVPDDDPLVGGLA